MHAECLCHFRVRWPRMIVGIEWRWREDAMARAVRYFWPRNPNFHTENGLSLDQQWSERSVTSQTRRLPLLFHLTSSEQLPAMSTTTTPNSKAPAETAKQGPSSAVEFEPPLACVRRILKNSLPSSTNVGKDASAAFARSTGIFIIYLTACANDFARENRRQTITANDVLAAIKVCNSALLIPWFVLSTRRLC